MCMKDKHIYYNHSCHTMREYYIYACSHSSQNHITCSQAPTWRCLATCSRSCRVRFSSCVASRTSPPLLACSWHRRTPPNMTTFVRNKLTNVGYCLSDASTVHPFLSPPILRFFELIPTVVVTSARPEVLTSIVSTQEWAYRLLGALHAWYM